MDENVAHPRTSAFGKQLKPKANPPRRRIVRGRKILGIEQIEAEFQTESTDTTNNESLTEELEKCDKRRQLFAKRDLVRQQQEKERKARPDFNIVTDIPPEPNFEVSSDSQFASSFASSDTRPSTRQSTTPSKETTAVSSRSSLIEASARQSITPSKEITVVSSRSSLIEASARQSITPSKEITVVSSRSSLIEASARQSITPSKETTVASSHSSPTEAANATGRTPARTKDETFVVEISKPSLDKKDDKTLAESQCKYGNEEADVVSLDKTSNRENEALVIENYSSDVKADALDKETGADAANKETKADAFDKEIETGAFDEKTKADVFDKEAIVELDGRNVTADKTMESQSDVEMVTATSNIVFCENGTIGLSTIEFDRTIVNKSEITANESQQGLSVLKASFQSERERLLRVLRVGSNTSFAKKESSKTLLSFKTPQRGTRVNANMQGNVSKLYGGFGNKATVRMTSTPLSSPVHSQKCGRFEEHQMKFTAIQENNESFRSPRGPNKKKQVTPPRGSVVARSRIRADEQEEMVAVSPNTRVLKSAFKRAEEPPGSRFRVPKVPRPSLALQRLTSYESPSSSARATSSSPSFDTSSSYETNLEKSGVSPAGDENASARILSQENCNTVVEVEKPVPTHENSAVEIDSSSSVADDDIESLERSTSRLSLAEIESTSVQSASHTPERRDSPRAITASCCLDDSILTVGTPGLERRLPLSRKRFNLESPCSSFMDVSGLSSVSNDSAVSTLPYNEGMEPKQPIHLISRYKRSKIPELIVAKQRIVHPEEEPMPGVRRSQRNRVPTLRHWLGEKAVYEKDENGGLKLVDVKAAQITDTFLRRYNSATMEDALEEQKRKKRTAKLVRRKKMEWKCS